MTPAPAGSKKPTLLIATTNPGKTAEFAILLAALDAVIVDLTSFSDIPAVVEDGFTYRDNARLKACAYARHTGLTALADDSGLEVDALDGAPGVHSARFAGEPRSDRRNLDLLFERMRGVPPANRTARFRCVLVVAHPDGRTCEAEGTCEGFITEAPRGSGGFGYDPAFHCPQTNRTFAELDATQKNSLSHRAHACRNLMPQLGEFLRNGPAR